MKIIVDHRESKNPTTSCLSNLDIEIEMSQLQVGDFILSDDVCVELKKVQDFTTSLIDGRLFNQATELKRNFNKPLYIIEGNTEELFQNGINPNAIRAAMISLLLNHQIPIIFSRDPEETAHMLFIIAKREQVDNNKEVCLRGSRKAWSLAEQQQFLIEGLPKVGPNLAKSLLKKFKTPKKILNAKVDKLKKVDKIGDKKAEIIRKILDEEYDED